MVTFIQSLLQPVIAVLDKLLAVLFDLTHDWGIAVVALTLLVRLLLFAVNLRAVRQQVRQRQLKPALDELRSRHKDNPLKAAQETSALYRKHGIKPLAAIGVALLQMPVFMGMYGLFTAHGASMTSVLVPWVAHLAQADPHHLLPAAVGLLTFLVSYIPLAGEGLVATAPAAQRAVVAAIAACVFGGFVMWRAPVALGLYSLSGSLFALMERAFYRTKAGRSLLLAKKKEHALS